MMDARTLLQPHFSSEDFDATGLAIAKAYKACSDFMRLNVVTSSFAVGLEQWPHLLRAFVDHSIMRHEPDVSGDMGYIQILHGGNSAPEFLMLAIPSRDQLTVPAGMELAIPPVDTVEAEMIREEMALKLKKVGGGDHQDEIQATG